MTSLCNEVNPIAQNFGWGGGARDLSRCLPYLYICRSILILLKLDRSFDQTNTYDNEIQGSTETEVNKYIFEVEIHT